MLDTAIAFAVESGFEVELYGEILFEKTAGTIDYDSRSIIINRKLCCSGCWLMTLLHELGHMRHFFDSGVKSECEFLKLFPEKTQREKAADDLGRRISNQLGFKLDNEWEHEIKNWDYVKQSYAPKRKVSGRNQSKQYNRRVK